MFIMKTSHKSDELKNLKRGGGGSTNRVPMAICTLMEVKWVPDVSSCQWLATGGWLSPDIFVSSNIKTDRHVKLKYYIKHGNPTLSS